MGIDNTPKNMIYYSKEKGNPLKEKRKLCGV